MATTYICKCGRMVTKSTNADTTGNRDTAGCEGCPYLLPWGPFVYKESIGYVMDVHGYECRMSKNIEYDTRFFGSVTDKCSCHIHSLDFDFLTRVIAWIRESNGELFASFSPDSVRPCEYMGDGRYRMSIGCAQNKKGIAAKTAFLEQFFGPDKRRLDMTPEEEKAHILAAIEAGKARAQRKENTMVYKDPSTGWLYRVSPKPDEKSCFFIEYLDPESSVVWKRDHKAAQGHPYVTSVQSRLLYLAKEKGWVPMEEKEWNKNAKNAQRVGVAVTTETSAAANGVISPAIVTQTSAEKSPAPASHADAGSATQSLSAAEPASLEAESAQLAFDYSGLDTKTVDTLHVAEQMIFKARRDAHIQIAQAVSFAHDALCGGVVQNLDNSKHGNRGDESFGCWCKSVGIPRSAAYSYLNVARMFFNSTPEEQAVLLNTGKSLLAEAAKPSTPAEVVQAVKDGDITTHKQYQEAMAQLKAEREAREKAEQEVALASEREEKARAAAHQYHVQYEEVNGQRNRLLDEQGVYISRITEAEERAKAAEAAAQDAAYTIQRKQEAIEELDEIARDRLAQIETLEKGRTIEAQVSDPEEVRRQAEALARELAAAETAGLQEENRLLRSCAPAVRQAWSVVTASMNVILEAAEKAETEDENGLNALEACREQLLTWWSRVSDITNRLSYGEEYGHDEN